MSARANITVSHKTPCDGGVSPNAYIPWITTEIRMHFPPTTVTADELREALDRAYAEALRKIESRG